MCRTGKLFIVLLFIAFSLKAAAQEYDESGFQERYPHLHNNKGMDLFGVYWRDAKPNEYVYLVPAHFGATVFILIGNVIGTPAKAIYNVCTLNFKGDDYLPPIDFSNRYFAPVGGYLLGTPFWALEKVFYEAPASLFQEDDKYHFSDDS